MQEERTFVPKYEWRQRVALLAAPFMAVIAVAAAASGGRERPELYLGAAFFGLCAIVIPVRLVRRIRFGSRLHVDRYLLPPRSFEYADVVDVGVTSIKTRRGAISLYGMENVDELHHLLDETIRRGLIAESQIEGSLAGREVVAWLAGSYAILPAIVFATAITWLSPIRLPFDPRLQWLLYFSLTYPVAYGIAKAVVLRRARSGSAGEDP